MRLARQRETLPGMFLPEGPKHVTPVRQVSIAQYADGRERFKGRRANVLRWLAGWWNRYGYAPTSGELAAQWAINHDTFDFIVDMHPSEVVLYVRRGMSDLQAAGVVEAVKDGERKCEASGRTCETWRVTVVGR